MSNEPAMTRSQRHPILTSLIDAVCVVVAAPWVLLLCAGMVALQRCNVRRQRED